MKKDSNMFNDNSTETEGVPADKTAETPKVVDSTEEENAKKPIMLFGREFSRKQVCVAGAGILCAALLIGGGVVISRYFGARDEDNVSKAVHTNFLMGLIASAIGTVAGLILAPHLLVWLGTPDSVMPHALRYLQIYFGGVSTVILYNICMSIMRALGDSIHPLYYLLFSSIVNIGLDLLFVAHPAFHWGVTGAAAATVISQGLSVILCLFRMCRQCLRI